MKEGYYSAYIEELKYLLKGEKYKLISLLFLFLFSSLFDIIGIGLIVPYVAIIANPELADNEIVYLIKNYFDINNNNSLIIFLSYILVLIFFIKTVLSIFVNWAIVLFGHQQQLRMRKILMKSFQSIEYIDYTHTNSSEYIVSVTQYTGNFSTILQNLLKVASELIISLAIISTLFIVSPIALSVLIIILGLTMFLFNYFFKNKVEKYGKQTNIAGRQMIQALNESLSGFKEVRVLGKEQYFFDKMARSAKQIVVNNVPSFVINMVPRLIIEFVVVLFIVMLVLIALYFESSLKDLTPVLATFGVASLRIIPAANAITTGLIRLRFDRDAISKLYNYLKKINIKKHGAHIKITPTKEMFSTLSIDNVVYGYPNCKENIFNGISLQINSGDSIGIVGPSGSGKTTLIDLLLGLISPDSGQILFNGKSVSENIIQWRSQVAYLPQHVFLTDDTLRNNIALGVEDSMIDDDRIVKSIKKARLEDLINKLPLGHNAMVGENGDRLSGGQRQRVALARAFYNQRSVIIMDESTSALDKETEKEIIDEIKMLKGVVTSIIISHHDSTLKYCDCIYKINNGILTTEP
jgi:ABC-type multidrug transport system fused ATPase/permease subunit